MPLKNVQKSHNATQECPEITQCHSRVSRYHTVPPNKGCTSFGPENMLYKITGASHNLFCQELFGMTGHHIADIITNFKSLRPKQNSCLLADDIFKFFFNGDGSILIILCWSLILRVQPTPSQHWFRWGPKRQQAIISTNHYSDFIMGMLASQITSLTIVYSTVYSSVDQRKHQSSTSLAFVREIHRWPVNSPHKWPVTRKMFPFNEFSIWWRHHDDVLVYRHIPTNI